MSVAERMRMQETVRAVGSTYTHFAAKVAPNNSIAAAVLTLTAAVVMVFAPELKAVDDAPSK